MLLARGVLEAQLVEAVAARAGAASERALRLLVRQRVRAAGSRRCRRARRPAAGPDRPRGNDHDLLADARQVQRAPARAGPRLAHAHPARALLVALALAIPVELDLDAAVLVGVDLLARGADHDGRLRRRRWRAAASRRGGRKGTLPWGWRGSGSGRPPCASGVPAHRDQQVAHRRRSRRGCSASVKVAARAPMRTLGSRPRSVSAPCRSSSRRTLRSAAYPRRAPVAAGVVVDLQRRIRPWPPCWLASGPAWGARSRSPAAPPLPAGSGPPARGRARAPRPTRRLSVPGRGGWRRPGRGVCAVRTVSQHQGVRVLGVLEEVEDALLLEQARDEVEVRLAVLHAEVPRGVAAAQARAVRDARLIQHLLDDLRDGSSAGRCGCGARGAASRSRGTSRAR